MASLFAHAQDLEPGSVADVEWKLMPDRSILIKQARPFRQRTAP